MDNTLVITKKYEESNFSGVITTNENIYHNNTLVPIKVLWDTGSSISVISSDLVKKLNLKSIGLSYLNGTNSFNKSNIYEIILLLAEEQRITLHVTESHQLKDNGLDFLIGLDVICMGDFAISTYDGTVCFSFRYPSQGLIDFNAQ